MKIYKIKVLFGEEAVRKYDDGISINKLKDSIQTYSFQSENEAQAFILGLKESLGWLDFQVIENANKYITMKAQ
jgi:hypothetical protein